jgi:hypothetical protein
MPSGPRVLLVAKRPLAERLGPADTDRLARDPRIGLDVLRAAADAHAAVRARVAADLAEVPVRERVVDELDPHDADEADVIVTVGGDGTVFAGNALRATRPVITVNSDPRRSVGHFTRCTVDGFAALFAAWRAGATRIEPIPRLQVSAELGDGAPHRFLNDCLFTSRNPAAITRYVLEADGACEPQQSSGVWVATGAGSTAGIRSAGMEPPLASGEEALLFKVREPFQGRGVAHILDGRQLPPRGLQLTATMPGIDLYLDGPHRRVPIAYGATARFGPCPEPLPLVVR